MKNSILFLFILTLSLTAKCKDLTGVKNNFATTPFQDPVRTSDNRKVDPSKNLDGSYGKYRDQHKHANGKKFATKKRHIKTAKPGKDKGKEKSKPKSTETGS